ncbi:MAG TPA: addiction module protein [Pirellulales bacterium]|nr:addiction module protein [Pirellulales bacterium]
MTPRRITNPQAFVDAEQRAEIERQLAAIDAGTMAVYPWEEVKQRLRNRHRSR